MTASSVDFVNAVSSTARNVFVIAPPGCGKTELLAMRAGTLLQNLRPGQKILALTFSNKAKANLNSRLVKILGAERKRRYVSVHNFHGHAAEIVRSHGLTLGIDPGFEMPDKRTQTEAIAPYVDGLDDNSASGLRQRIADELRGAKQRPNGDEQVATALGATALDATQRIEAERQAAGVLHYDDLLRHAQRLLRVPEIATLYRTHYGAILVDEFQDLSPQQLDIALRSCDANRTFVGDPLQGIYSWTGARPVDVERLLRRICGEPLGLGLSYRSSPRVLDLLNAVSVGLGGQALQSNDPDEWFRGGIAAGFAFDTGVAEATYIETLSRKILRRQPNATIGVICRSGWRRKPIDAQFATSDLPSTRWDLAVEDPRIVDLITEGVSRLGGSPSFDSLKGDVISRMDATDVDTAADVIDALDQLADLADQAGSIGAALSQLRLLDEGTETITPGVHLLNAHTGKGQQFDWVFVPGFEDGNVPSFLAKGASELKEEHRVLLVMLSRARHGIVLTRAKSLISKRGKPYETKPSRWASEVRTGLIADSNQLVEHVKALPQHAGSS